MLDRKEARLQIATNVIQTGEGYDWILGSIQGDDFPESDITIKDYADADGGYIANERLDVRYIDLKIVSRATSDELIIATELLLKRYMNMKAEATLTVYKYGVTRIGTGRIAKVKRVDGSKWYEPPFIQITFVMPNPWFFGEDITETFMSRTPIMTFPLSFIAGVGLTVGVVSSGNVITFDNNGHAAAGFVLTLTAKGTVVNPTVTNQNGLYVKVLKTLANGDILIINTVWGNKEITCNGSFCKYDRASNFFPLEVGSNTITVSADSGVENLGKSLLRKEPYIG